MGCNTLSHIAILFGSVLLGNKKTIYLDLPLKCVFAAPPLICLQGGSNYNSSVWARSVGRGARMVRYVDTLLFRMVRHVDT